MTFPEIRKLDVFNDLCLVNGQYVASANNRKIDVFNPFNREWLADVPSLVPIQILEAIAFAQEAQFKWRDVSSYSRREMLKVWKTLILNNIESIAAILVSEQGKPYNEAISELRYGASFIDFYADEAIRIYGETIPSPFPDAEVMVIKEAIGVVGIIAPCNFPVAMIMRNIAPCLAAGCTCVVKPDERSPLSAFSLMKLAVEAGFPAGVINCITGDSQLIGEILCTSNVIKKISFTGSTTIGKKIMSDSSKSLKRLTLELGGNAPFVVFNDAIIEEAVHGLMFAKFRNTGQTCISANRVYIHASILQDFIDCLMDKMTNLRMGSGFDPGVSIGPIIDSKSIARLEEYVLNSVELGAKIIYGGEKWDENQNFYRPTIMIDACDSMPIMKNEIFGPIIPISCFDNDDEILERINDSVYGLACYLYTKDMGRIIRFKNQLQYGMVGINTGLISSAFIPFGGIKESGFGREGSRHGLDEYLNIKYICLGYS
jgi:succinate-semialdehyde dehydrogenase/glutarate-semialdehyde dehydrogenase